MERSVRRTIRSTVRRKKGDDDEEEARDDEAGLLQHSNERKTIFRYKTRRDQYRQGGGIFRSYSMGRARDLIHWNERTIMFQLMLSVLGIFSVYSVVFIFYLFFSVEFYQDRLIQKNNDVIEEGSLSQIQQILDGTIKQTHFFLDIVEQTMTREGNFLLNVLDSRYNDMEIHPISFEQEQSVSVVHMLRRYPMDQIDTAQAMHHQEPFFNWPGDSNRNMLQNQAKKIRSLQDHFPNMMKLDFGTALDVKVDQVYFELTFPNTILYSYPAVLDMPEEWRTKVDAYDTAGDIYHNELVQLVWRRNQKLLRETDRPLVSAIDLVTKDLRTDSKQVISLVHPIAYDRVFWGIYYWEIELHQTINETIIPTTFWKSKYSFLQIIYPEKPTSGKEGTVIFEYNGFEPVLKNINSNPAFVAFRESLHRGIFTSGEKIHRFLYLNVTEEVDGVNNTRVMKTRPYRFHAQSMRAEDWEGVREFDRDINTFRFIEDLNLIFIIGEDVYYQQNILQLSAKAFIDEMLFIFKWATIGTAIWLTIYFVIFNMGLVKIEVVNPIVELTDHICSPQDQEKINKFISSIKKREYEREFKQQQYILHQMKVRRKKMKKKYNQLVDQYIEGDIELGDVRKFQRLMEQPMKIEIRDIDEVEQLRLLFSKFFKQSTNNEELHIPSKYENIYNYEEFIKSSKKDLIVSNLLSRKIVMMIDQEGSSNYMHEKYQAISIQQQSMRNRIFFQESNNERALKEWIRMQNSGSKIKTARQSERSTFSSKQRSFNLGGNLEKIQQEGEDEEADVEDVQIILSERSKKGRPPLPKGMPPPPKKSSRKRREETKRYNEEDESYQRASQDKSLAFNRTIQQSDKSMNKGSTGRDRADRSYQQQRSVTGSSRSRGITPFEKKDTQKMNATEIFSADKVASSKHRESRIRDSKEGRSRDKSAHRSNRSKSKTKQEKEKEPSSKRHRTKSTAKPTPQPNGSSRHSRAEPSHQQVHIHGFSSEEEEQTLLSRKSKSKAGSRKEKARLMDKSLNQLNGDDDDDNIRPPTEGPETARSRRSKSKMRKRTPRGDAGLSPEAPTEGPDTARSLLVRSPRQGQPSQRSHKQRKSRRDLQ